MNLLPGVHNKKVQEQR